MDEVEVQRRAALDMRRDGLVSGVIMGVNAAVLLFGAMYINQRYKAAGEDLSAVRDFNMDPVLANQMASKLSFSIFPGFVLAWLSYVVMSCRPVIDETSKLDHVAINAVQKACKTLMERVNVGRMFTNIFAVVRSHNIPRETRLLLLVVVRSLTMPLLMVVVYGLAGLQLFVWRMSAFYRQMGRKDDAAMWFTYALVMAGLGLLCGVVNTLLHFRVTKSYRLLTKSIQRRFGRPY